MDNENTVKTAQDEILRMTAQIVAAYVGHNEIAGAKIPDVIRSVYSALNAQANGEGAGKQEPAKPAVSIRKSVTPD